MGASTKMTVREAFSLAFGEVPEGATCHVAVAFPYEGSMISPVYVHDGVIYYRFNWSTSWSEDHVSKDVSPDGPDISDRPAESFLGFFGEKYDKVVQP